MAKKAVSEKQTVFVSHIHGEEHTANTVEAVLRKALLGAIDIFNSSNRRSISPGDPWRDRIINTLQKSTCVLVLASPNSELVARIDLNELYFRCLSCPDTVAVFSCIEYSLAA